VNVVRAFGWEEPTWVHLSLFLKPSGKGKLSKRDATDAIKDGYSVFVKDMHELGFIPEGILNWIALMGWGVAEDDVLGMQDMIARFDLDHLTASPAAINFAKLDHFNATHIRLLTDADLAMRIRPYFVRAGLPVQDDTLLKLAPLLKPRLTTLDDSVEMAGFFFRDEVGAAPGELVPKGLAPAQALEATRLSLQVLEATDPFAAPELEPRLRALVERLGLSAGQVFGILRAAVTGQKVSPPLFESMEIIGKHKVLQRVRAAIAQLERMP
jgi:glutamyl-tRNA synthetase